MIDYLKKILYLLPSGDKIKLCFLFLMMFVAALLEVVGIGMIPVFVSIVATPETVLDHEWAGPLLLSLNITEAGELLVYGAIALIGVFLFKNIYLLVYKYAEARFLWGRFVYVACSLFKKYMTAPYEFHLNRNTAELLRNVNQESRYIIKNVMASYLLLAMDVILIIAIFSMLLFVEPLITLFTIVLLGGAGGLFLKFIKNKTQEYGKTAQNDRGMMIQTVNEGLGGFKDATVLNRQHWFYEKFRYHIKRFSRSQAYREVASVANKPVIETIAITGMLLIAVILYLQGRGMEVVLPILTLFGVAIIRLLPAIQKSAGAITTLRYYLYTVDPVYDDMKFLAGASHSTVENRHSTWIETGDETILQVKNHIKFAGVSYRYPNSNLQAVINITLTIQKGEAVGFVGSSGAGKTTLIDLLLGLLRPQEGRILVDETNIHSQLTGWQKNIGYIPQFIYLVDDSIKQNIAFGLADEDIDEEKLNKAVQASQLSEFIDDLPDGVNTVVGEHGTRLSGGQRQRIGIARALYNNPQVLIMDEATASLDNITERFVIEAIDKLKGERTILMIAHRLSTVKNCDHICFMKHGRIVDQGPYDQLMENNQDFYKMATN